jgi:DNA-binding LytR/AlgR family response regulator
VKVLIVDDEAPARRRMARLLEEVGQALEEAARATLGPIEVAGEAASGEEALAAIGRARPDLLLLDIEMPELDGMALAARYVDLPPLIFVTAHDQHAVRAFDLHAVDYLLKPVRPERLLRALLRAAARPTPARQGFAALPPAVGGGAAARVVTQHRGAIRLFDACTVSRFWASSKYTLFLADGEEQVTEEPLAALEQRLAPLGFMRVHRGELIRVSALRALVLDDGRHWARLEDGQVAAVSRRLVRLLKEKLGS